MQLPIPPSGTEDCLYLNIFRPNKVKKSRPLNVLVFIHGGGFYSGTNNPLLYGADFWMETQDVILVTITHRCNVFGFLATGDEASPGNYGLKDQTMAMRWVRDNIAAFGGDPGAVTLSGQSAGAASVNYHLISNHSRGLYKNALMISGNIIDSWGEPIEDPRGFANRHASKMGIVNPESLSSAELVQRFREMPAKMLTATLLTLFLYDNQPSLNYLPSVEPEGSPDPFLSVSPRVAMERGDFTKVPIMNSMVPVGDGGNLVQPLIRILSRYKDFNERIYEAMPIILRLDRNHPNITQIVDRIRFEYFGPTGFLNKENLDGALRMSTDYYFGRPFYRTMQWMVKSTGQPVYGHYFNYRGHKSFSNYFARSLRDYGVFHVDDLLYLFRIRALYPIQLLGDDFKAKEFFKPHILNFIKNDDPGYERYDADTGRVAIFENDQLNVIKREYVDINQHEFWEDLDDKFGLRRGAY